MSAQDELPPGWSVRGEALWPYENGDKHCADSLERAWQVWTRHSGITREEYATMRAALKRDKEAWAACEFVAQQLGEEPESPAQTIDTLWKANEMLAEQSLPADVERLRAAVERCAELEAELEAERDEFRVCLADEQKMTANLLRVKEGQRDGMRKLRDELSKAEAALAEDRTAHAEHVALLNSRRQQMEAQRDKAAYR